MPFSLTHYTAWTVHLTVFPSFLLFMPFMLYTSHVKTSEAKWCCQINCNEENQNCLAKIVCQYSQLCSIVEVHLVWLICRLRSSRSGSRDNVASTLTSSYPWYAYFGHTILRFCKGAILINKRCLPLVFLFGMK